MSAMTEQEISRLSELQKSAYELLLWINLRAKNEQNLLSDQNLDKWRFAQSCETWVRSIYGMIPISIRPKVEEIPAFARLFSSFFQTSFRLSGFVGGGERQLIPGDPSGKKTHRGKERVSETAHKLCVIALEELALEIEFFPSRSELETIANNGALSDVLTMWTYINALNRRAHFSSQGEAVHHLWLAMEQETRENLDSNEAIRARDTLLAVLQSRKNYLLRMTRKT